MRKRKVGRKFGLERDLRWALLREMSRSLFRYGRIRTTEARAKELRSVAERLLTYEKRGGLANRRRVWSLIGKDTEEKAKEAASRFKDRAGGYTRIRKLGVQKSNKAKMAIIEFVS